MGLYGDHVLPRIIDVACGLKAGDPLRERVCGGLEGDVVEIGFGSGLNVPFYPATVTRVAAIEPADTGWTLARKRVAASSVPVERSGLDGQSLPFEDDTFDLALAQLVVHFMKDPVAGLAEMARVTKPGGIVAANVWDHARGNGPVTVFWTAVHTLDPAEEHEATMPGIREGHLAELFTQAGLTPEETTLSVDAHFESFDDWWIPYTKGVGPAGEYVKKLDDAQREQLRDAAARLLPEGPFDLPAQAWCVSARV